MEGYNGWKNWATWNVALWLANDEGLYKMARRFVHYKDLANELEASTKQKHPTVRATRMKTLTPMPLMKC